MLRLSEEGSKFKFLDISTRVEDRSLHWLAGYFIFATASILFSEHLPIFLRQYGFQIFLLVALISLAAAGWKPLVAFERRTLPILLALPVVYLGGLAIVHLGLGLAGVEAESSPWPQRDDLLLLGVIAPVVEELFFRDLLFRSLSVRLGRVGLALFVSSLLFMLAHLTLYSGAFFLGLIGASLVLWSGSIWPSILFHSLSNLTLYFIPVWFPRIFKVLTDWELFSQFYR